MRILSVLAAFAALAVPATAQDGFRDGDERLSRTDLTEVLAGHQLEFYDDSLADYAADGGYQYVYEPGGRRFIGTYEVRDDSSVCVVFNNGFDRCDYVIRDGDRLVMIVEKGDRYPIRVRRPIPDSEGASDGG